MIAVADTDALLGIINKKDLLHEKSAKLAKFLDDCGVEIVILPTTLSEFALIASSRIGIKRTQRVISYFLELPSIIVDITRELTAEAIALFKKQTSKENSLFDCFIMVVAKKLSADCIFSFDRGYTQNGFLLAQDWRKRKYP